MFFSTPVKISCGDIDGHENRKRIPKPRQFAVTVSLIHIQKKKKQNGPKCGMLNAIYHFHLSLYAEILNFFYKSFIFFGDRINRINKKILIACNVIHLFRCFWRNARTRRKKKTVTRKHTNQTLETILGQFLLRDVAAIICIRSKLSMVKCEANKVPPTTAEIFTIYLSSLFECAYCTTLCGNKNEIFLRCA